MRRSAYVANTLIYGLFATAGITWAVVSLIFGRYLLFALGIIFAYVSVDNFFCGAHARSCGYKVKGHYSIPPFLRGIKLQDDDSQRGGK